MIAGLDSAQPPSAAQVAAARAAGVGLWSGYLATAGAGGSAFNLERVWSRAEFDVARQAGGAPVAFCSGWDDPAGCRDLAAAWGVRLCLDVEDGIRPDGPWVQPWLNASGAGLYGNLDVHAHWSVAFHILSYYPDVDPGAVWTPGWYRPPGPVGWQWQGGPDADRGWYDDWFGGTMITDDDLNAIADRVAGRFFGTAPATATYLTDMTQEIVNGNPVGTNGVATQLPAILAAVKAVQPGGVTPAQLGAALRAAAHALDGL